MTSSDLPKLWTTLSKISKFWVSKLFFIHKSWSPNQIFFTENFFWRCSTNFRHWKMTLKLRILISLTRLFIILVSLRMSLFSEKMLISSRCISGLMPNLIKKSWTVSITHCGSFPGRFTNFLTFPKKIFSMNVGFVLSNST